jgi:hypothetical protein
MARVKRTLREEYSSKKKKLSPKLAFLEGVRFYAVVKHRCDNGKWKTRIEFSVRPLSDFVELVNGAKEIQKRNISLAAQMNALESQLADQENENESLKKANDQLMANLEKCKNCPSAEQHSSIKTYCQVAEERGFMPTSTKPYPGGNTGLGKKS